MSEDKPSETRYMGLAQLRQEGTWQDHTTGPVITDHAEIAELERAREIGRQPLGDAAVGATTRRSSLPPPCTAAAVKEDAR